ncbi:MAG: hypothetical protein NTW61_04165 [Candidatus Melainabacteria bacterium]|jgi:hypothetical protein|nr:hypothetical protein [Candidatus Melainabacteria bacterium]
MILNITNGFPAQNNGKITTAFNGTSSESVADKAAKAGFNPSRIGTSDALAINNSPQAGWQKLYATNMEGGSFSGYTSSFEQQSTEKTKPQGKNALWKQIIKEASKGSGLSNSKPSAGGDAFAGGYATDLSSSAEDSGEE